MHIFWNLCFFFFTDPPTTEIYTLSLHDALPISGGVSSRIFASEAARRQEFGVRNDDPAIEQRFSQLAEDRKSTRLNSSHMSISYAVFCLKKKKEQSGKRTTLHRFKNHHKSSSAI